MINLFARNTVRWEIDGVSIDEGLLTLVVRHLSIFDSPMYFKWIEQEKQNSSRKYFEIDLRNVKLLEIVVKHPLLTTDPRGSVTIYTWENEFYLFRFEDGIHDFLEILYKWPLCQISRNCQPSTLIVFWVTRPFLNSSLCSVHEGTYPIFTNLQLEKYKKINGRITNLTAIKRHIFYSGISFEFVPQIWPILFDISQPFINEKEHRSCLTKLFTDYEKISISDLELELGQSNWSSLNRSIEQDVARTAIPLFSENSSIIVKLLLKFASYNRKVGYQQGMSDILSVLHNSLGTEEITFWCFVRLIKKTPFESTRDKHAGIHHFVVKLKELTSIFLPSFYTFLKEIDMGLEFLFSHRWFLVNCIRDFSSVDSQAIITAIISSNYDTKFIIYICLAICACYHRELMKTCNTMEDVIEYFLKISYTIPLRLILQQARGFAYLHNKLSVKQLKAIFP